MPLLSSSRSPIENSQNGNQYIENIILYVYHNDAIHAAHVCHIIGSHLGMFYLTDNRGEIKNDVALEIIVLQGLILHNKP